ncbi:MAG: GldG family protein [Oscillospiraceae bacterium]|nr:GldG family protein [Oscillospiraceae bacterium]
MKYTKKSVRYKSFLCLALCLFLAGCSTGDADSMDVRKSLESEADAQTTQEYSDSQEEELPQSTTEPAPRELYYITSSQTQDTADLTAFIDRIRTDGYNWHEVAVSELPADAGAVILNSPQEDLSAEDFTILEEYMNTGGRIFVLLPASESETRYKYLDRLLEEFYIRFDYNLVTDEAHILENDYIQMQAINYPDRFLFADESMENGIVYMRNARSFHHLPQGENTIYDAMLQTFDTASGLPYGGVEDDPEIYESEKMDVMIFCREEIKKNACVVVMGSSDFLLDENYEDHYAKPAQNWAYSAIDWLYNYSRNF